MIKTLLGGARDQLRAAHDLVAVDETSQANDLIEAAYADVVEALRLLNLPESSIPTPAPSE